MIAIVGIVVGRAVYQNGLDADGRDPRSRSARARSRKVFDNGYYFDVGHRPARERTGHRGRARSSATASTTT